MRQPSSDDTKAGAASQAQVAQALALISPQAQARSTASKTDVVFGADEWKKAVTDIRATLHFANGARPLLIKDAGARDAGVFSPLAGIFEGFSGRVVLDAILLTLQVVVKSPRLLVLVVGLISHG